MRPRPSRSVRRMLATGTITLRYWLIAAALLCLSIFLPVAGFHRLYLRMPGWWLFPMTYLVSVIGVMILAHFPTLPIWTLLFPTAPVALLVLVDSTLIWHVARTKASFEIAEHHREFLRA